MLLSKGWMWQFAGVFARLCLLEVLLASESRVVGLILVSRKDGLTPAIACCSIAICESSRKVFVRLTTHTLTDGLSKTLLKHQLPFIFVQFFTDAKESGPELHIASTNSL